MKDKIAKLIKKYEKYIDMDDKKELDEYENGEHDALLAVIQELKEIIVNEK